MAKPSTGPVAASWAEPTSTGGVCGPAVLTISEALAPSVRSNERRQQQVPERHGLLRKRQGQRERTVAGGVQRRRRKDSGAPVAGAAPLLTKVNVVVQFSCRRCAASNR